MKNRLAVRAIRVHLNARRLLAQGARSSCGIVLAASVAACGGNDDFGPGLTVQNQTSSLVSLYYASGVGPVTFVANLASGNHANFVSYFVELHCLSGSFLAKHGSTTIAELRRPCEGATWVIAEPDASPSTPSSSELGDDHAAAWVSRIPSAFPVA